MHLADRLEEADRLMTICNSCRYCEGLCAVFPAMEMRRTFAEGDLHLLANLCHNCGACYDACQFAPPHDFSVNVPQALANLRLDTWSTHVWPRAMSGIFQHNAVAIAIGTALLVAAFLVALCALRSPEVLFAVHTGPGSFYKVVSHDTLAGLFGLVFLLAIFSMAMGLRSFWREVGRGAPIAISTASLWQAIRDASTLRYLDGGGLACSDEPDPSGDRRRTYHHLTFYGFLLCFAATSVATVYHYVFGLEAPYAWWDLPVVLGTLGGIGLVIGPIGLVIERKKRRPDLRAIEQDSKDTAFSALLVLTSLSGLALLVLRETPMMTITLAIHLGFVCAFFLAIPYSRFVHGSYRFLALVRYALERRNGA